MNRWTQAVARVGLVYVLAGTGGATLAQVAADPAMAARSSRNTALYAPESGRWFDAADVLQGGVIDAVTALSSARPTNAQFEDAKEMIRRGVEGMIEGELTALRTAGLDDGWRVTRLAAMAAFARKAAGFLHPAQCTAIRGAIGSVVPALAVPSVQTGLGSVSDALHC